MTMRAYQYRFYPTAAQRLLLDRYFGTARWAWNHALERRSKAYRRRKESITGVDISRAITQLKKTSRYAWIKLTPATVVVQRLRDQDTAFQNFFAGRARYPRFKKRGSGDRIRFQLDQRQVDRMYRPGELLKLPGLGPLKLKWSRSPNGKPKMVTVRRDAAGAYFVSFACEELIQPLPAAAGVVGVDTGITDLIVTSDGFKSGAGRHLAAKAARLARAQRVVARRKKGSNRRRQAVARVAKLHRQVRDARADFTHKLSTTLIRENQVICVEDLNVKGMMKNRRLARSLADAAMGELHRQLAYKAQWHGRELHVIDRWAPSSKVCSGCGHKLDALPLSVRHWVCPQCEASHDRDINAAVNIRTIGTGGSPGGAGAAGTHARGGNVSPEALLAAGRAVEARIVHPTGI